MQRPESLPFALLLASGLFRLWLCTRYALSPDESYYWLWSKHLDWCYYSKGPLVAWTIWLGTAIGGDSIFGVRWPAVFLHVGTGFLIWRLARRMFDSRIALWSLVTAMVVPLFALGSVLMTIDSLSVFFWIAAANAAWEAHDRNASSKAHLFWLLAGLLIGLGFLAKFTNAIQGLCLGLFLLSCPRGRQQLRTPWPWAAALLALALTLPFWTWNAAHDWVTFGHLQDRGSLDKPFQPSLGEFLQFIQGQALVFSPFLWLSILAGAVGGIAVVLKRDHPSGENHLYLLTQFLPLLGFFALFALNDAGQPNWTVPGYCTGIILAVVIWLSWIHNHPGLKFVVLIAWVTAFLLNIALHDTRWIHHLPGLSEPWKKDPMTVIRGWDQLADRVRDARSAQGTSFVIANHYQVAASLSWQLRKDHPWQQVFMAHNPELVQNQFDFWPGYQTRKGENALFITTQKGTPRTLRAEFESVKPLGEPFWIFENGVQVQRFRIFDCRNFKGASASPQP